VGLLFSIYLALQFGITGALIASVTFQSVVFGVTLYLIRDSEWFRWEHFTQPFKWGNLTRLSKYSLMAVASAITVPAAQMIVRGYIVNLESVTTAGIWEGLNRITSMYLMVITTSLGVYFLPKIAQLKNDRDVHQEVMKVYKLIIPFLILTSFLIYVFRFWVIRILFTPDFYPMESLFATQLIGEDIRIMGWVTGYLLLAKAMYKKYIFLELLNFTLLSTLNYWLIAHFGVWGATLGQVIIYSVYFIISLWFFRKMFFLSADDRSMHEKIY
jgi:PST family polysaccharide transporter